MSDPERTALRMAAAVEAVQAMLDVAKAMPETDGRSLAVARTQFEGAFLWLANALGGEPLLS